MSDINSIQIIVADLHDSLPLTIRLARSELAAGSDRVGYHIELEAPRLEAHNTRTFARSDLEEFLAAWERIRSLPELGNNGRRQFEVANLLAESISFRGDRDILDADTNELHNWDNLRSDFELRLAGNCAVLKIYFNFQHGSGDLWRLNLSTAVITSQMSVASHRTE